MRTIEFEEEWRKTANGYEIRSIKFEGGDILADKVDISKSAWNDSESRRYDFATFYLTVDNKFVVTGTCRIESIKEVVLLG